MLIVGAGHPNSANSQRRAPRVCQSLEGAPRFCQILIIKKTEIYQIRPYITYRCVIKKMYIYVRESDSANPQRGSHILPIHEGGGTQILQAKIEKPPPPVMFSERSLIYTRSTFSVLESGCFLPHLSRTSETASSQNHKKLH